MRNVFFSFHYKNDSWRVQQIINMGIVDGQKICNPNEWETIKRRSDDAIQKWIDENYERSFLCCYFNWFSNSK